MAKKDRLKESQDRLYRRGYEPKILPRRIGRNPEVAPTGGWQPPGDKNGSAGDGSEQGPHNMKKKRSLVKIIFLFSLFFFLGSATAAVIFLYQGVNTVSNENITITVDGPASVAGGEELPLEVTVRNGNQQSLELVDLVVTFPPGTTNPDDPGSTLERSRFSLGTIESGQSKTELVKAALFGEEGSSQEIQLTAEYRISGSNAIYVKESTYLVTIRSTPLSVSIDTVSEVSANQRLDLTVTLSSNSNVILPNVLLRMEYPFGFEPETTDPEAAIGGNLWQLGDLPPGGERTIRISGFISGQDGEEKVFRAFAGSSRSNDPRAIGTVYGQALADIDITRTFIGMDLSLDGDKSNTVVRSGGESISGVLSYVNNLDTSVRDVEIELMFTGNALDPNAVTVDRGFYDSNARTIRWSPSSNRELSVLNPGGSGRLTFQFTPQSAGGDIAQNPAVDIAVSVSGRSESEIGSAEAENVIRRTVQIASAVNLSSRAVYSAGPFDNSGPLPPEAEAETTYTILWSVVNPTNDISDVVVRGSLPSYVSWMGNTSGEGISFSAANGEVTWEIPDRVPAGTGIETAPIEAAFQVRLTPSTSQVGSTVDLVRSISIEARDEFTNTSIRQNKNSLNTAITTDPLYGNASGRVQPPAR